MGNEILITKKMSTGEIVKKYPATKAVFAKYFGTGCFDCPSFGTEDINLACMMHNTDVDKFIQELNEVAKQETSKTS
ncbi:MAG: DUF1858 domain-containing protein [Candidatus Loosdrechtia sp.]|uniref:DUF1858 domain-containing protein n=1 Tax=Candidatus Loosdrechtia sp. TaxID=3101272 RepID=UPI003A7A3C6F|nr:MAG: DUF1858 domain-containing protein [Candidatus Jettenia sp. AMX2]